MNIAVVGAGLTGLSAALKLSRKGHNITIFEREENIGGLASSQTVGSGKLERFYHHIFVSDKYFMSLLESLKLDCKLNWFEPKNAVYSEDYLYPFTTPLDLLRFKPLSLTARIRTGWTVLSSKFIKNYMPFSQISAREWIIGHSGQESYEKLWESLLRSKFDSDSDNISGTWIWNKFKLRGSSRANNLSKERLGYMSGGFITLFSGMEQKIRQFGGVIKTNSEVTSLRKNPEGTWEVTANGTKTFFDIVLFTASPRLLTKIADGLDENYKKILSGIRYKANLCLILELSESLSPYYWITVSQKDIPFVLAVEHTNLTGLMDYGSHIVYLSRYLDPSDPLWEEADEDIVRLFTKGLKKIFPAFEYGSIKRATLNRARDAQPVVAMGYEKCIPGIKTPEKGLYLASMAQIYPEDRGMNYAVRLGNKAASEIQACL